MKKLLLLASLAFTINAIAQCSASYTYTTGNPSISATSTSTGTLSTTTYSWVLQNASGVNLTSYSTYTNVASFPSLYNGTYSLTLTISDSLSCSNSITQTISITGSSNAPVCSSSFSYSVGSGGTVTFTNTSPTDPLSNTQYTWDFGLTNATSNSTNPTYTYYYNNTFTVSFNVNNPQTGCSTSSSQTLTISNANPLPPCNSNFTYTLGPTGLVNFTGLYAGVDPSVYFNWTFGDGQYAWHAGSIPSYTYNYNGTYSVTLNIQDSLANCNSTTTQTITITNAATMPCTPTVIFNMHKDSINPLPGIWEISAYYSPQVTSAVWYWGDGSSTAGLNPTHNYATAGHYTICVTVFSSCGDSANVCQNDSLYRMSYPNSTNSIIQVTVLNVNGNTTGIKTITSENVLSIYPNPSSGLFTLQLNNISSEVSKAQISITNILGEVIYTSQEQITNNTLAKNIDLQNIPNGTYFMKVIVGDKTFTSKTIISK